jgi:CHAD domain-containing protein
MADQMLLETEPIEVATDSKWITGITSDQRFCEVAGRVLSARLNCACHSLTLAAEKSDKDLEHVHRLRISVRRAVEAVRVFAGLMEEADIDYLRHWLRRIRLASDDARNLDVLMEQFVGGDRDGVPATILEKIVVRRQEAQGAIIAVHQEITPTDFKKKTEQLVEQVDFHRQGEGKRRFGRVAPKYLAAPVKKFFNTAESKLSSEESLHALRIRTKKLRYTMEIVAVAFDSVFRKRLYAQVTRFQDLLGTVNDHVTARNIFQDWQSETENGEERAFFDGVLLAEHRAVEDLRSAFFAVWTPKIVSDLKRQFHFCCGKCRD